MAKARSSGASTSPGPPARSQRCSTWLWAVTTAEAATAPFFTGSEIEGVLDEFPFLRPTVVRDPSPGVLAGESSGLWRPLPARQLLWEHGREELARLTAWLATEAR